MTKKKPIPSKRSPLLRRNPLLEKAREQEKKKEESKAVRVRMSSYEYLRRYAFENDITMIDAIDEALELLKNKHNN